MTITSAIAKELLNHISPPPWAQALNVVGEAGEFAEAYRRYTGNARRISNQDDVGLELADVVISAYVMAELLQLDLDCYIDAKWDIIMSRGFGNQG